MRSIKTCFNFLISNISTMHAKMVTFYVILCVLISNFIYSPLTVAAAAATTVPNDRARIIGGIPVKAGELKYQLSLQYLGLHHCGASLVQVEDVQVGLTAAHCVSGYIGNPQDVTVVAGEMTLSERSRNGTEQTRQVTKIVNHQQFNYNITLLPYDIGLLFFDEPFVLNDFVGPVPLPPDGQETTGKVIASGWGVYNADGFISDNLTKLEIPVVDLDACKKMYAGLANEFQTHYICTLGSGKDSCKGDSGGPLYSIDGGYLAGIISWGGSCGHPKFPSVNTKVSFFTNWITEQVKKHKGEDSKEDESDEDNDS